MQVRGHTRSYTQSCQVEQKRSEVLCTLRHNAAPSKLNLSSVFCALVKQSNISHSSNPSNSPVINKAHIAADGGRGVRVEVKEHVFLNVRVKQRKKNCGVVACLF